MKRITQMVALLVCVSITSSCAFNTVRGNGKLIEKEIAVADYHTIQLGGGASIVYEQRTDVAPYLKIVVDENILPLLAIESGDSVLRIGSKENIWPTKCQVFTNSAGLKKLDFSGSIDLHLKNNLVADRLNIDVSGSGKLKIDNITCNQLFLSLSGSSNVTLAGQATELKASLSGSGKVEAEELVVNRAVCRASGSGNFRVHAVDFLEVSISGAGKVRYKGDPEVEKSISGAGKIERIE